MPGNDKESYKEMFEMGSRLVEMAKAGGYDPESDGGSNTDSGSEYAPASESSSADKVGAAMSLFGGGK